MLGSKYDATMGWTGDRTDSLKCFDDKMICVLKKEGNTVMQIKTFKKTVRKIYKHKTGISFKKYNKDYIYPTDDQVKDAMAFWYEYVGTLAGFEVIIRPLDNVKSDWGSEDLYNKPCVVIERKYK